MQESNQFNNLLNQSVGTLFKDALSVSMSHPSLAVFAAKTLMNQKKAVSRRMDHEEKGIHVPPFMIASITQKCNLRCKGCYAQIHHGTGDEGSQRREMSAELLEQMLVEARELGISIVLLAGGEPLVRKAEVLSLTGKFPEIIFPLFTNGLLIDDDMIRKLKKQRNVIPVISLEGDRQETDERRGDGVHEKVKTVMQKLKTAGIFFGTSITVTRENHDHVTSAEFVVQHMEDGCKLFLYVEYVPVKEGTENLVLTQEQTRGIPEVMNGLRQRYSSLFIAFPGDEDAFGGCLAAGRGFVHINHEGGLEPCPFAPYSDTSLKDKSLKEALQSEFLRKVRQNHSLLSEGQGGCALWEKRDWVRSLL